MKLALRPGITSYRTRIFVQDTRQANIQGLTGLAYNSSGLKWYYFRDGDTSATSITPANTSLGTWTSGGFKEIDATNLPGWYELGIPNACLATGDVGMSLYGAANMGVVNVEIQLQGLPIDLAQPIGAAAWSDTIKGALNGALSTAAGRWTQAGTDFKTRCAQDGTVFRDFTLDSSTNPQDRTPN